MTDKDKALDTVADANVDLLNSVTHLAETGDMLPIAEAAAQYNSIETVDALERGAENDHQN